MNFALPLLIMMMSSATGEGLSVSQPMASSVTHGIAVTGAPNRMTQLRIQRRIIIRVPRQSLVPMTALTDVAPQPMPIRFKEKKIGKCMGMNRIMGVRRIAAKHSLDLFTRDNVLIRMRLSDRCVANEFYSGFYLEKSEDGKFCVKRDVLQARSGVKCAVDSMKQLIAEP